MNGVVQQIWTAVLKKIIVSCQMSVTKPCVFRIKKRCVVNFLLYLNCNRSPAPRIESFSKICWTLSAIGKLLAFHTELSPRHLVIWQNTAFLVNNDPSQNYAIDYEYIWQINPYLYKMFYFLIKAMVRILTNKIKQIILILVFCSYYIISWMCSSLWDSLYTSYP